MPPHTPGHMPLGLGELAHRSPEAVALAAPHGRSLTFRGLVDQIESAGGALRNAGAYAGSATALALTEGRAVLTAALAIMTGSACAPVELNLTEKEYKDYFGQLRPAALVWDEASNPVAAQAARQLGIGVIGLRVPRDGLAGAFEIVEVSAAARDLDIRQTDQAMIFQTSATTGVPKLVPRSHAALEILASENAGVLELSAADRYLNLISLTHAAGPDAIFRATRQRRKRLLRAGIPGGRLCGMAGCFSAELVPGYSHRPSRDSSGGPASETGVSRRGSAKVSCAPAARPPTLN